MGIRNRPRIISRRGGSRTKQEDIEVSPEGLKKAAFKVSYQNNNSTAPSGTLILLDISGTGNPRLVVATSFTWMVIPSDENVAYIEGICMFNGQTGYAFSLQARLSR